MRWLNHSCCSEPTNATDGTIDPHGQQHSNEPLIASYPERKCSISFEKHGRGPKLNETVESFLLWPADEIKQWRGRSALTKAFE